MTTKLRLKVGEVEIDYEGDEKFLKEELPKLLKTALDLKRAASLGSGAEEESTQNEGKGGANDGAAAAGTALAMTTANIAAKLGAKKGPDLMMAAAAHLTFVEKKGSFPRKELLADMRSAVSYFKKNMVSNLSSYLKTAVAGGRLSETAKDQYALPEAKKKELRKKLADA